LRRLRRNFTLTAAGASAVQIWVDADACPKVVRDILFRAAERAQVSVTLVANQPLDIPRSRYVKAVQVPKGFDVADNRIVQQMQPDDLVITADIPLAAAAIAQGGQALNPRGELYTTDNIQERLAMRDFMDTLRSSGVLTNGPPPLTQSDRKAFADALDRLLAKKRHRP
jgi:uncharacterized protein YaiI (UPF0178 family)